MDFDFNVNEVFKDPITEIDHTMLPTNFCGKKCEAYDAVSRITKILNAMGEASAKSQGLRIPITTVDRVRYSNNKIYFMVDKDANEGKGAVTGMLKTGVKGLYVFDKHGQYHHTNPKCVLDFYVAESRQRSGLGKELFDHMLKKQAVVPEKLAIDKPTNKMISFLNKHYNLKEPIKQMNNFVIYNGFFSEGSCEGDTVKHTKLGSNGMQYELDTQNLRSFPVKPNQSSSTSNLIAPDVPNSETNRSSRRSDTDLRSSVKLRQLKANQRTASNVSRRLNNRSFLMAQRMANQDKSMNGLSARSGYIPNSFYKISANNLSNEATY
ncbi:alpha-tubulin N-acetyltransferase [Aethina tumida]|uniref:alpha-tubulin N-acetyltransferase n=1 Tax=Aethina tumida TaxID=116153 RepID=UPI00096AEF2C|nr:alpha-tubulin N-acetyltransferase [Aethina tumida]